MTPGRPAHPGASGVQGVVAENVVHGLCGLLFPRTDETEITSRCRSSASSPHSPLPPSPSPLDLSLFGSHGVADKHAVRRFPLICHQFCFCFLFFPAKAPSSPLMTLFSPEKNVSSLWGFYFFFPPSLLFASLLKLPQERESSWQMEEEEVAEEKVGKCRADRGESSLSYSQSVRVTVRPSARRSLMSVRLSVIPSSLWPGETSVVHVSHRSPLFNSSLWPSSEEGQSEGEPRGPGHGRI